MSEGTGRSYGGRSADERDAQRRARLLRASHQVIGTEGYAATTVEKICTAANVSTRHFYRQYETKEDAFIDLYESLVEASSGRILASLQDTVGKPMSERIPPAFLAYLTPMFDDPRTARIAFVEIMGASPRIEELRLRFREALIGLVEAEGAAAVERGEISPRDFRFAALALVGAATAIVYDWLLRTDRVPLEDMQQALANLAVDLLTR